MYYTSALNLTNVDKCDVSLEAVRWFQGYIVGFTKILNFKNNPGRNTKAKNEKPAPAVKLSITL